MTKEDEENIRILERNLAIWQAKLESYRDDFVILSEEEIRLSKLISIANNTDALTDCLDDSTKHVDELSKEDVVPFKSELMDTEKVTNMNNEIRKTNEQVSEYYKSICEEIEEKKDKIADMIEDVNETISMLETSLRVSYDLAR